MTLVRASDGVAVVACSTCRCAGTPRGTPADGAAFVEALVAAKASDPRYADIAIEAMPCLFACGDACTVHLRGPGRIGYVLGRFDGGDADARAVLDHAVHYAASTDGQVPYRDWPAGVKGHFLVRVPPAGALVA